MDKPIRIFNIKYSSKERRRIHELVDLVLDEAFLTNHTFCRRLEDITNEIQGTSFSIATTSATAGLEAVFRTIDVKNKAVIVQSNTFIATGHAIEAAGGIIVPWDLDDEYVASFDDLKECVSLCNLKNIEIGAVCIVHISGRASRNLFKIKNFLNENNIPLVEDNAQGFLSKLESKFLGSFGKFSVASFQSTKVVACGEGGLISCQDEADSQKIRNNIFFGKSNKYPRLFDKSSGNYKLSELNAALAIADIERCEARLFRRREIDKKYKKYVHSDYFNYLNAPQSNNPSNYKSIFMANSFEIRELIERFFKKEKIPMTGSVYREPLSMQPRILESNNYLKRDLINTKAFCSLHFTPPNYPELQDFEVDRIIKVLNKFKPDF